MTGTTDSRADRHGPGPALQDYVDTISGLTHDLRTPLTSIVGAASSLQAYGDRFDDAVRARLLASIVEEAEHLDLMLRSLSLLAKARAGVLVPDRQPVRLTELLATLLAGPASLDDRTGDAAIAADPRLLQDAVLGLVRMVRRFAPPGAGPSVVLERREDAVAIVLTSPIDGATRGRLTDLLQAFAQQRGGGATHATALILLDAAREVVHSHGGCLRVETADDSSLTVCLTLPT